MDHRSEGDDPEKRKPRPSGSSQASGDATSTSGETSSSKRRRDTSGDMVWVFNPLLGIMMHAGGCRDCDHFAAHLSRGARDPGFHQALRERDEHLAELSRTSGQASSQSDAPTLQEIESMRQELQQRRRDEGILVAQLREEERRVKYLQNEVGRLKHRNNALENDVDRL